MIGLALLNILVSYVANKISKTCGVLNRVKSSVPTQTLRMLYMSLIYPFITYGIPIWGAGNLNNLSKLRKVQDRCIKSIRFDLDTPIVDMYKDLKLFPLQQIYEYFCLIKLVQYKNLSINNHFSTKFTHLNIDHDYGTRLGSSNGSILPSVCKTKCSRSFFFQAIKIWNSLPPILRKPIPFKSFKHHIKVHLLV